MKYATERKIIHDGGAYGSLNAQQSIISNRTRTRDALFGPSDDGASNGTNESIYGGLAHIMDFICAARKCSFLGIFGVKRCHDILITRFGSRLKSSNIVSTHLKSSTHTVAASINGYKPVL